MRAVRTVVGDGVVVRVLVRRVLAGTTTTSGSRPRSRMLDQRAVERLRHLRRHRGQRVGDA